MDFRRLKLKKRKKKNENVLKPVVVRSISTSNDDKTLEYIGVIEPETLKKDWFETFRENVSSSC